MAAQDQGQEKTDPASPWKRREARRKGDVPKSQDVNSAVSLMAVLVLLHLSAMFFLRRVRGSILRLWDGMGQAELDADYMMAEAADWAATFFDLMWPILLTALLAGTASNLLQVGFLFSGHPLKPDFQRLNPFNGLKRIFSAPGFQGFVQSLLKVSVVAYVAYRTLSGEISKVAVLPHLSPGGMVAVTEQLAFHIFLNCGIALLILALADYGFKRWQWEREKRMTKQETKEEHKRHEGDPIVRQRIREQQRMMATKRMMQEVPESDVVITNPTHVAVALKYSPEEMGAPMVVAKGRQLIAERIKELAREHRIPVVLNPALARSLEESVEVGREVPEHLYRAVAEVLAYVYRLRGRQPFRNAG
ncbi:MAG: flagellar biosynthesis protein FlhB [Armatimonadia bacterium]|nr:flagellar biosynthesis protein FlhB [Armatimonadia bacterium]